MFRLAVFLLSVVGFGAASYPAEYPFENESNVPVAPRAATPSLSYDDADPGGYVYTYAYKFEITADMFPFCFMNNGFFAHQYVVRSDMDPIQDISYNNCTSLGESNVLGDYTYFGVVADEKICEEGECCKDTWGLYTLFDVSSPYPPYYDDIGKTFTDGGCSEMFGEEVYCLVMSAYHEFGCINQMISESEREQTYPCYDSVYHHYMACPVYKTVGTMWRPTTEPEAYLAESSAEEINAVNGLYWSPDRVCRPYSFYYPETAKTAGGSSSTSSASDASSASSDDESSASSTVVFAFLAAVIALQ